MLYALAGRHRGPGPPDAGPARAGVSGLPRRRSVGARGSTPRERPPSGPLAGAGVMPRSAHQSRQPAASSGRLRKGDIPCAGGAGDRRPGPGYMAAGAQHQLGGQPSHTGLSRAGLEGDRRREKAGGHEIAPPRFHFYVEQSTSHGRGNLAILRLIKLIQINSVSGTALGRPHRPRTPGSPASRALSRARLTSVISNTISTRLRRAGPRACALTAH